MQSYDLQQRTIGVNFKAGKAEILVWAPYAKTVDISINDQFQIALYKREQGYWNLSTQQLKPFDNYYFVLDEKKKFPDPASLSQPLGVHKASKAIDLNLFEWTDTHWENPPLHEYIIYELHVGAFSEEGNFAGIGDKLDYLKELGITAIEIMPIASFPGGRNWGYDGVYLFAVQESYGGATGLQRLINSCHLRGIAVILDVVYNHVGPEGNYMSEFGPYFTDKYKTPWGSAVNFDDAGCDAVRSFFIENALMWFRDFHVDALRLDAVHAIKDLSAFHFLKELREQVDLLSEKEKKDYYLIVENDLNDPKYIDDPAGYGYGMDTQWVDEFHHALRVTAGQKREGYYSDFSGIEDLAKAYSDVYVYDGQYSEHRQKSFGAPVGDRAGQQFVVFSQNHDQVGNRMLGERTSQLVSFEMQKLLAAAIMVSPYIPLLFMGEEWGETNPFLYFVSHTDAELAQAVSDGRKKEFQYFHIDGEVPDPNALETFERSQLQWHLKDKEQHKTLFTYYKKLIELRKDYFPLRLFRRSRVKVNTYANKKTLVLYRWHKETQVICFMNFSKEFQSILIHEKEITGAKLLDSADSEWLGESQSPATISAGSPIHLSPQSCLIYTNKNV